MIDVNEILLIYGLVAGLAIPLLSALLDAWFVALISFGTGVFATVLSLLEIF